MLTAFDLAQRYVGVHEIATLAHNHPLIQWWLSLCGYPTAIADEVPWCSAFVNGIAWELRLPRSKSAAARSWLSVGRPIEVSQGEQAEARNDVVVLKRKTEDPGADVLDAHGHVGFFAAFDGPQRQYVLILGGNQRDGVTLERYPYALVLGIRRLLDDRSPV